MKKIIIKNLYKKFENNTVIKDVNLSIDSGSIVGIIGKNGSGKTVLLKLISGFLLPTSGTIKFNITPDEKIRTMIDANFLPDKTASENLELLSNFNSSVTKKNCDELLFYVGLDPYNKTRYKNFSMGMKQKLSFAQVLLDDPKILVLDEPFNALDIDAVKKFRELLIKFKNDGKTIIITSHNEDDIKILCDRVYIMEKGSLKEHEKKK